MLIVSLYRFKLRGFINEGDHETEHHMTLDEAKEAFFEGSYEPMLETRAYKWADENGKPVGDFITDVPDNTTEITNIDSQKRVANG